MSTDYFCWTIPVAGDVPCSPLRKSELGYLLDSDLAKQHTLMGISRSDSLAYLIEASATRFEVKGLEFHRGGHETDDSAPFDRWLYSFLDEADIERGVLAIDKILALAAERPQTFATVFPDGEDADGILDALSAASDQFQPFRNPVPGIDGEGALYFFTYLKWLRVLMRWALDEQLRLMHIRMDY